MITWDEAKWVVDSALKVYEDREKGKILGGAAIICDNDEDPERVRSFIETEVVIRGMRVEWYKTESRRHLTFVIRKR